MRININIDKFMPYFYQVIITAIIVVIGLLVMKYNQAPLLVKIDLVEITTHYTQMMAKETLGSTNLSTSAVKRISDTIKTNLEPLITNYAKTHHVIIIQSQAIVGGNTPDITGNIIKQLDEKLL